MRNLGLLGLASLLAACEGSQAAGLELRLGEETCGEPRCQTRLLGQGLYVSAGEVQGDDPLANEEGQLLFYGEGQTETGTTVVVELAFGERGLTRARYREIKDGRVLFRGRVEQPTLEIEPDGRRRFHLVAVDGPKARIVDGTIEGFGQVVINEEGQVEGGGCGGEDPDPDVVIYWPAPGPVHRVPDPNPSPTPTMPVSTAPADEGCGGGDPEPNNPDTSGCEGDTSTPTSSDTSGCEGDTSSSSSSSGCEGDTSSSSSSSSGCEGDSSSSSSSSSSCEGDTVSAAACAPLLPWDRILAILGRTFGPISLVGVWNRIKRRR
ncbi:MAG: hypothetical protein IPG45_28280 [Deltaproteobacteria bacterium]|jgi:hypothetical protein|nr:hypothetical protein [Deltaproteobacteria bacterium]